MTDKSHLSDPLGYLYEEIPPEAMARARKHLAECPDCLKDVKAVREAVKAYRSFPRAKAPEGLRDRLMRRVMESGRPADATVELAAVARGREAQPPLLPAAIYREELEQIESMRRFRWRTWFFHPAWTVAASVVFICAILIHLSPRRSLWFDESAQTGSPAPRISAKRRTTATGDAIAPAELRMDQQASAIPAEPVPPPNRPDPQETTNLPHQGSVSTLPPKVVRSLPSPLPPPAPVIPQPLYESYAVSAPAVAPEIVYEQMNIPAAGPPPPLPEFDSAVAPPPLFESNAASAPAVAPKIMDYFGFPYAEPPPIVKRPESIDKIKLTLDLVFLAGMQMGQREFREAAKTIELLMPFHPEKAGELLVMLDLLAPPEEARVISEPENAEPPSGSRTTPQRIAELLGNILGAGLKAPPQNNDTATAPPPSGSAAAPDSGREQLAGSPSDGEDGASRARTAVVKTESEPDEQVESVADAEVETFRREEPEPPMQPDMSEAASAQVAAHEAGIAAESIREDPVNKNADGPVYSEALENLDAFTDYDGEDGIAPASAARDGELVPGNDRPDYPDATPAASGTGSAYPRNPPPLFADDDPDPARTVNAAPSRPIPGGRFDNAGQPKPFSTDPYIRGD
ncbi:MAG: hypothetical protein LBT97_00325 [Planctomycetota bacterium]|jgi:hypothetical protein|nr:hypothetical protein [Planctomycetota bacterium]